MTEIEKTLIYEGGYVDDPNDAGGETKYGIAKRFHPDLDIQGLTQFQAIEIYKADQWAKLHCDEIKSLRCRWKIFDMAVNLGMSRAVAMLQRALNDLNGMTSIAEDGIFGSSTLARLNTYLQSGVGEKAVISALMKQQVRYYVNVVVAKPTQLSFLKGWINRALDEGEGL